MYWMPEVHLLGQELYYFENLLIFLHPIIDALLAEEITTSCAFFRCLYNVSAYGAVKHVA